jgi:hypothetical protein
MAVPVTPGAVSRAYYVTALAGGPWPGRRGLDPLGGESCVAELASDFVERSVELVRQIRPDGLDR